ncbi:MAG: hypothetical protein IM674_04275 [Brevundimonas sp.]|jgi:hypothetical protein|nr:hypothetical protein [Brevundimonas sp.]
MSSFTDYSENAILNWLRGSANMPAAVSPRIALFTVAPNEAGTGGTEVSGAGYARVAATFGSPSGATISNTAAVDYGTAGAAWGTVVAAGIYDAATAGNLLAVQNLVTPRVIANADPVSFPIGSLTFVVA